MGGRKNVIFRGKKAMCCMVCIVFGVWTASARAESGLAVFLQTMPMQTASLYTADEQTAHLQGASGRTAAEDSTAPGEDGGWPGMPDIAGESGIVMEVSTGAVLCEKDMHSVNYPASITKIMTALLAIENCELDEIVTVPPEAVYMEDKGTHIALDVGEELTVEQCLYAVLLASANDAAHALAAHVGGTVENFVSLMNERARQLGCLNTNFTNPHGLPQENHVTTAYDMALITRAALEYDVFRAVSGTSYYEIPPSEHQKDLICMYNHHKMIGKSEYHDEEVFAGKNGYTNAARNTLVTCAGREGMEVICVVMKAEGTDVYRDTQELLTYGMGQFSKMDLARDGAYYEELLQKENPVFEWFAVASVEGAAVVVPKGLDPSRLHMKLVYGERIEDVELKYYYDDHFAGKTDLTLTGRKEEKEALEDRGYLGEAEAPEKKEREAEEGRGQGARAWRHVLLGAAIALPGAGSCVQALGRSRYGRGRRRRRR